MWETSRPAASGFDTSPNLRSLSASPCCRSIAARAWRIVAGAAISSIGISLAGVVLFGLQSTVAWFHELLLCARVVLYGLVVWPELASVYAAARQLGLGFGVSMVIHGIVAACAGAIVWRVWRSPAEDALKVATLAAASMLASPYLFYYDGLMLVPAFFWLAREEQPVWRVVAIWCIPLLAVAQVAGFAAFINLNPLVPVLLLVLLCRQWRSKKIRCETVGSPLALRIRQPSAVTLS